MSRDPRKNPLELERALLDELPEARAEAVRAGRGDELRALAAQDRLEREALLEKLPAARFRERVERRARAPRRTSFAVIVPALAAAAAVLFAWVGLPREGSQPELPGVEITRTKGMAPELHVFRKRGEHVEELAPGALVAPADMLQLSYVAAGQPYGLILSLDGAGAVTVHAPGPRLEPSGSHLLDNAYVLDAAPGFERFVLVASPRPLDLRAVIAAAEALAKQPNAARAALVLPRDASQSTFLVHKVVP